ncbi:dTDP-4-dehydrorhamnose reductase [Humibacter sp. BT305]|uniref:dTDP-4-dehydrorhamnose reductase n=1 Tax=Cnuibacter physcomitrellae TaxID=1619308 RepID=A0A1X9LVF0_9MICO|nr:dTDP-4-dehydrorhamnose reductase [Cnuibacter physcomitrellae]ARJ06010.1 dTDP-4-dehydrorhamnose reductase [Cnuibacter physcomitrellae]AXH35340.1 dTDP-4-dehydrorhamnose reductase [Humibacter sp. BT305]GGI37012.1 NAD(P)-dependent oxidoreductase [Cnuibacter physcomitrellae]
MTRYLITGASGMLGHDLQRALAGRDVVALSRAELDITDPDAVAAAVAGIDVVFNCAAYTKVDAAETDEDAAYAVNATGAATLALATAANDAALIQVSTDYVFQGDATSPYSEDEPRDPLNAYGRTKAAGEEAVLRLNPARGYVVRTAWLYGADGPNFPATMLRLGRERDTVSVVDDQVGQPTWTADLARQLVLLADSGAPAGIYHGTNAGTASWFEFAQATFQEAGLSPDKVEPTDSSQFVRPAPRPAYSVLGHDAWSRAGLAPMRDWRAALHEAASSGVFGE